MRAVVARAASESAFGRNIACWRRLQINQISAKLNTQRRSKALAYASQRRAEHLYRIHIKFSNCTLSYGGYQALVEYNQKLHFTWNDSLVDGTAIEDYREVNVAHAKVNQFHDPQGIHSDEAQCSASTDRPFLL